MVVKTGSMAQSAGIISANILNEQLVIAREFLPTYTSLIATESSMDDLKEIAIKWESYRGFIFQRSAIHMELKRIELNYMSHIDGNVRKSRTVHFCPSNQLERIQSGSRLILKRC